MKQMDKLYFVYILTNYTNTTLYTGITANIKQRIYLHKNEIGSVFTTKYKTNKLVYYEVIKGVENAIKNGINVAFFWRK
jgi:putative endonuclease